MPVDDDDDEGQDCASSDTMRGLFCQEGGAAHCEALFTFGATPQHTTTKQHQQQRKEVPYRSDRLGCKS